MPYIFNLATGWDNRSASYPGCFTPEDRTLIPMKIGDDKP